MWKEGLASVSQDKETSCTPRGSPEQREERGGGAMAAQSIELRAVCESDMATLLLLRGVSAA